MSKPARISHEGRIVLLAFLAGLPGSAIALYMLWTGGYRAQYELTFTTLIVCAWLGFAFDWNSIHFLRTGPSLGCAQDDHRPDRLLLESALARLLLNGSNLGIAFVQRSSQDLMDDLRIR